MYYKHPSLYEVTGSSVNCSQRDNFYMKNPIPVNLNGKNYNWFISPKSHPFTPGIR
jgi:hypothetical protein